MSGTISGGHNLETNINIINNTMKVIICGDITIPEGTTADIRVIIPETVEIGQDLWMNGGITTGSVVAEANGHIFLQSLLSVFEEY